jgi:hypothetical protein
MSIERRISHRLVNYWQQIKGDRLLPLVSDIDYEDIQDMWTDCFLIRINGNSNGLELTTTYDYVGDSLRSLFIEEIGKPSHLASLPYEKLLRIYQEMCMTNLPVVEDVEEFHHMGYDLKFRQCLLPLGDKGITSIFGGMRYKKL